MYKTKRNHVKDIHVSNLVITSVAGGVIGISAALLLLYKGDRVADLCGNCNHFFHKAENIQDVLLEKGRHLRDEAGEYVEEAKERASEFVDYARNSNPLLLGAIGAGILGITTILVFSKTHHDEADKIKGLANDLKSVDWAALAKQAKDGVNSILEELERDGEAVEREIKHGPHSNVAQDVVDWAVLGLRLWQSVKKKR